MAAPPALCRSGRHRTTIYLFLALILLNGLPAPPGARSGQQVLAQQKPAGTKSAPAKKKSTARKKSTSPKTSASTVDTLAAKQLSVRGDSLAQRDSVAPAPAHRDTVVVTADSTTLLLVSTAPDTARPVPLASQDTARTKEAHPQDSPVDRGFLLRTLDGKAELRIRGSVRLHGVLDLNGLQSQSNFNTYLIPVGDANKGKARFTMNARQTRIGLDATRKLDIGELFARVEADFLGSGDVLRLRHAYMTYENFLFGQTWSVFGDLTSIPGTVDLDGPNSSVSERTVQIRYGSTFTEGLIWDASVESPVVGVAVPDSVVVEPPFQSFPDFVFRTRYFGEWGHVQIAAVMRSITVTMVSGEIEPRLGYGFLLSGRMYLGGSTPHRILYQGVWGKGISRFIGALSNQNIDVIYDPVTLEPHLFPVSGGYVSYAREWSPGFLSYFTVGLLRATDLTHLPDEGFRNSHYLSANFFWDFYPGAKLGAEYSWGRRENKDGAYGVANRFSFIAQYDF